MPAHKGNEYARKYSDDDISDICARLEEYISCTQIPIIAEFAYLNNISRTTLYMIGDKVLTLLKKCIDKKEMMLEKGALSNQINVSMAIFSLKQLGWKDKQEIEHSGSMEIKVNNDPFENVEGADADIDD